MNPIGPAPMRLQADFPTVELAILGGVLLVLAAFFYLTTSGRIFPAFGRGLMLGLRGLLAKELRSRSRGLRPLLLLTGYLAALTLGIVGFLTLIGQSDSIPPAIGLYLFSTLSVGAVLLLAFITPALTAGAISGERERRTLDLLLVTRASALGLVSGKLLASLFYILFLLVASLPAFALVYLFGGVPLRYLGMVMAVAAVTALTHAALGLLLSALLRRTIFASVVAYLLVLLLVFGLPFVVALSTVALGRAGASVGSTTVVSRPSFGGVSTTSMTMTPTGAPAQPTTPPRVLAPPSAYIYASPLLSLASVLPAGESVVGNITRGMLLASGGYGAQSGGPAFSQTRTLFHSLYVVGYDPATGQPITVIAWAPWVYHFLLSGAFTVFCLLGAALTLMPIKPWRAWRIRRRRAILVTNDA
ncbi:MAG: ABC transporter permease [Chloroflexota bacterium]|nr:MAG: ABC transporter permease [Chloroflexota bacterium]